MIAGFAVLFYLQTRKKDEPKKDDDTLKVMMEWMKDIKQGTEISRQSTEANIKDLNKRLMSDLITRVKSSRL